MLKAIRLVPAMSRSSLAMNRGKQILYNGGGHIIQQIENDANHLSRRQKGQGVFRAKVSKENILWSICRLRQPSGTDHEKQSDEM